MGVRPRHTHIEVSNKKCSVYTVHPLILELKSHEKVIFCCQKFLYTCLYNIYKTWPWSILSTQTSVVITCPWLNFTLFIVRKKFTLILTTRIHLNLCCTKSIVCNDTCVLKSCISLTALNKLSLLYFKKFSFFYR